jgi:hypothetical protein
MKRDEKFRSKKLAKEQKASVNEKIEVEVIGTTRIRFDGKVFKWKGNNADGSKRYNIKEGQSNFRIL